MPGSSGSNVDITQLSVEVSANASAAAKDIDQLTSALSRLSTSAKLTKVVNSLNKLGSALSAFQGSSIAVSKLTQLSMAMQNLAGVQKLTGLNSALTTLAKIPGVMSGLQSTNFESMAASTWSLSVALQNLSGISKNSGLTSIVNTLAKIPSVVAGLDSKTLEQLSAATWPLSIALQNLKAVANLGDAKSFSGLSSILNSLKKIPEVTKKLQEINMDDFGDQIKYVAEAMAPLATEMDKVGKGFSALPSNIQKAISAGQKFSTTAKDMSTGVTGLSGSMGGLISKIVSLYTINRIAEVLGSALSEFNSYVENVNLFRVSMGELADTATMAAQKMQDVLGVDASAAMRNMGVIQNLVTSFGLANDQAYVLSENLTQLGYDMSSFFNISTEDAFTKLQAAISGELEPIRRLGVDISEARLQQELYSRGIDASVSSLNQADKAMLRYVAIMEQTSNAQGDMARTLTSPANQIRVLQQQITLLARSIGSIMLPVLNALLPPILAVVQLLREAASAVAAFFGVQISFADSTGSISTDMGNISSGIEDVGDSAAGASKEMRELIGGFDELNRLPDPSSSGGASGAGGGGGGSILGGLDLPSYDMYGGLTEQVNAIANKIKSALKKIQTALKPFTPLLKGIAAALLAAFAVSGVVKFIDAIKTAATAGGVLGTLIDAVREGVLAFDVAFENGAGLLKAFSQGFAGFQAAIPTWMKVVTVVGTAVGAFVTAYDALYKFQQGSLSATQTITNLVAAFALFGTIAGVIAGPVGVAVTAVGLLAGALIGSSEAQRKLDQAVVDSYLYNNGGVKIEYVTAELDKLAGSYQTAANVALENKDAFDQNTQSIADSSTAIYDMANALMSGYGDVSEIVPQMQEQFSNLRESVTSDLELLQLTMLGTLSNTPKEILNNLQINVSTVSQNIAGTIQNALNLTEQQYDAAKEYLDLYSQTGDPVYLQNIMDTLEGMGGVTSEALQGAQSFFDELDQYATLDFTSISNGKEIIQGIGDQAAQTSQQLDEAWSEMKENILAAPNISDETKNQWIVMFGSIYGAMIDSVNQKSLDVMDAIEKSTANAYTEGVSAAQEETKPTLSDKMVAFTQWLLVDCFTSSYEDILDGVVRNRVATQTVNSLQGAIDDSRDTVLDAMDQFGFDYVKGFADSVEDNSKLAEDATWHLSDATIDAMHNGPLKFGSPSKRMYEFGTDFDQGFANGISENTGPATDAATQLANSVQSPFTDIINSAVTWGGDFVNSMANGITQAIPNLIDQVKGIANGISSYLHFSRPDVGPLRDYETWMPDFVAGMARGVTENSYLLQNAIAGMASEASMQFAVQSTLNRASSSPRSLSDSGDSGSAEIVAAIQQLIAVVESQDDTSLSVDGETLFSVIRKRGRREQMRTGRNPFVEGL